MIKLLLLDVGETLLHGEVAFPHVTLALEGISRFKTSSGDDLAIGIVSDYFMPNAPGNEQEILELESRFRDILKGAGIDRFFQPFESRVTISSRAGVSKPAREIFDLAIQRSNVNAAFSECLFVTENEQHLAKCKEFEMTVVRFGTGPGMEPSFSDWSDGPRLLAKLVNPDEDVNREAVTTVFVAAHHDLHSFRAIPQEGMRPNRYGGQAQRLVQLTDPRLGDLDGVHVEFPAHVEIEWAPDGRIANVSAATVAKDEIADAINYVSSLVKSGKVAVPGKKTFGVTHEVETDAMGRKRLVRRGFSTR